jgi:hypothetical protein
MFRGIYRDVMRDQLESSPDEKMEVDYLFSWCCEEISRLDVCCYMLNSGVTKIIPR